jgi:2'-5' RNA ligase
MRSHPFPGWRLHLSLHFLDDYLVIPQPLIASLERSFAELRRPSFMVRFDRVLSFAGPHQRPGQYPLVLASSDRSEPLMRLYEATGAALSRSGHKVLPVQAFEPHMTLGYDSRIVPEQAMPELSWWVRDWVLVHNTLKTGRPYEILGRWPLQP